MNSEEKGLKLNYRLGLYFTYSNGVSAYLHKDTCVRFSFFLCTMIAADTKCLKYFLGFLRKIYVLMQSKW